MSSPRITVPLKLQLAEGFREVTPRTCGRRLIWEEDGELRLGGTDFSATQMLGNIGGVDCPIAVDAASGRAWTYCCQMRLGTKDFSEIREFDLATGKNRRVTRLGLHQWAIWMLLHWAEADSLVALVATDTRAMAVNIRHHLAVISLKTGELHLVALPRDAFVPIAWCLRRKWVMFHGAEGTHLVSFTGQKIITLPPGGPRGRGASFHPDKPLALLGGGGLWEWNLENNQLRQFRERGQYPQWTPDAKGCWFSESSSDLFHLQWEGGTEKRLLRVAGNTNTEITYARPLTVDAEGLRVALPLTRLLKLDPEAADKSAMLPRMHRLCVVDLQARETWMTAGYGRNIAWV